MDESVTTDERAGPPDGAPLEPLSPAAHLRSRALVLVAMLACAAAATLSSTPYPPRNVEGVVALLTEAQGTTIDPRDFVWEASEGPLDDLIYGRRLLFLARSNATAPRDLYRARITVTRQGRPMSVRSIVNLSRTEIADERDLVAVGNVAAVSTEAFGRIESIEWLDLAPRDRQSAFQQLSPHSLADVEEVFVSFSRPPKKARYEIQNGRLIMALGDEGESASLDPESASVTSVDDRFGVYASRHRRPIATIRSTMQNIGCAFSPGHCDESIARSAPTPSSPAKLVISAVDPIGFPPGARFESFAPPSWEGASSPVFRAKGGSVDLFALDMRQLGLKIVLASDIPRSRTGHHPRGIAADARPAWVAIAGPTSSDAGAVDMGVMVAPFLPGAFTLTDGPSPRVGVAGMASSPDFASVIEFARSADASRHERSALCATASGHFVYAWGGAETPESLQSSLIGVDCIAVLPIETDSAMGMAFLSGKETTSFDGVESVDSPMSMQWRLAGKTSSILQFYRKRDVPSPAPPRDSQWNPETTPQPDPAFAPAIYHSSVDSLGTRVAVRLFMPGRFDWILRAGDKEKTHRLGGTFAKSLDEPELSRAFVGIGLGIGIRKSPLGLRISGSTGHAFRHEGALIEAKASGLAVRASTGPDPEGDASEAPLTAADGALLPASRERGPSQRRADLCVLEDGTVLYAEAEFDSHEATATVLTELGCNAVAALDRGTDLAAWSEAKDHLMRAHDATILFGLARPTFGTVRADPTAN